MIERESCEDMTDMRVEIIELLKMVWPEWNIVREIGEGSFGKVYEIRREDIGGVYEAALKVISIPKDKSEVDEVITEGMDKGSATRYFQGIMEELVKEFALMERLKGNTNVVTYEDHKVVTFEDGIGWNIFIRMELLTPLTEYLKNHSMNEDDVIKLGKDICRALELCQKHDIIHRDIKPENIFVSQYGDYKLGDFGIARTAEKTMAGLSKKGTYAYMAPEVYKGDAYNATVDIYSLGIVLYRLLNDNRAPFMPPYPQMITFTAREEAQRRRLTGEVIPRPAHGSEKLADVIRKACSYLPGGRFRNAREFREALEAIGNHKEIEILNKKFLPLDNEETELILPAREKENQRGNERIEKPIVKNIGKRNVKKTVGICGALLVILIGIIVAILYEKDILFSDATQTAAELRQENETVQKIEEIENIKQTEGTEEGSEDSTYVIDITKFPDYSQYSVPEVGMEELEGDKCYFANNYADAILHYENAEALPRVLYKMALSYDAGLSNYEKVVEYMIQSAEGGFTDAQVWVAHRVASMGDSTNDEILSSYLTQEQLDYEYWMSRARENGHYSVWDDYLFNNRSNFEEAILDATMHGDLQACGNFMGNINYLSSYMKVEVSESLDLIRQVVENTEVNYETLMGMCGSINDLGTYYASTADDEGIRFVEDEFKRINEYMEKCNYIPYRDTSLILATSYYNEYIKGIDTDTTLERFNFYFNKAVESNVYGGYYFVAIVLLENNAPIYNDYEEGKIIGYTQVDSEVYAIMAEVDTRTQKEGWYKLEDTTFPQKHEGVWDFGRDFWIPEEYVRGICYVDNMVGQSLSFGIGEELWRLGIEKKEAEEDTSSLKSQGEVEENDIMVENEKTGEFLYDEAYKMLDLINLYRVSNGLPEVIWDPNREEWMRDLASRKKTEWQPNDDFPTTLVSLGSETASTAEVAFSEIIARDRVDNPDHPNNPSHKLLAKEIDRLAVGCYYSSTAEYKYVWFIVIQNGDGMP